MALHADTVWEVRSSGNNNNGGGWHDLGGASVDYSQQDAAQLSLADVVCNGTTTVTSATGGFTAAMAGSLINILTKGRFEIAVVTDGNTITIDRTATAGSGLTANVGGGVADLEEIDNVVVAGNDIHVKNGTYNSAGNIAFTSGAPTNPIRIFGYNASRGDEPEDTNAPLFGSGANSFALANYVGFKHFRLTISHVSGLQTGACNDVENGVIVNSNANGNGITLLAGFTTIRDCDIEAGSTTGKCIECGNQADNVIEECYLHDAYTGIEVDYGFIEIAFNTFDTLGRGVNIGNVNARAHFNIRNNGFWNCTDGILSAFSCYGGRVRNNQFTDGVDGIHFGAASPCMLDVDYNNYYNNSGNDVTNVEKGANATAKAPGYANPGAEDFGEVDDIDGFVIRKGVA
jgi:hypothetical protein